MISAVILNAASEFGAVTTGLHTPGGRSQAVANLFPSIRRAAGAVGRGGPARA